MTRPSALMRLQVHFFSISAGVIVGIALCVNDWCGTAGSGAVTVALAFFVDYTMLSRLYPARPHAGR